MPPILMEQVLLHIFWKVELPEDCKVHCFVGVIERVVLSFE